MKKYIQPKKLQHKKDDDSLPFKSPVSANLEKNINILKDQFENSDVTFRSLMVGNHKAYLIFIDGLVDKVSIELHTLHELLSEILIDHLTEEYIEENIVSVNKVVKSEQLDDIINQVLDSNTVLLVDKLDKALVLESKGGVTRSVSEPETEASIRGPREGFTENLGVNKKRHTFCAYIAS